MFRTHWQNDELFVLSALVRVEPREAGSINEFFDLSNPQDYWLAREELSDSRLRLVREQRHHWLYQRLE